VSRFVPIATTAAALVLSFATAGSAASASQTQVTAPLLSRQSTSITRVDYDSHGHRYHHRRWDKHHRRWEYY